MSRHSKQVMSCASMSLPRAAVHQRAPAGNAHRTCAHSCVQARRSYTIIARTTRSGWTWGCCRTIHAASAGTAVRLPLITPSYRLDIDVVLLCPPLPPLSSSSSSSGHRCRKLQLLWSHLHLSLSIYSALLLCTSPQAPLAAWTTLQTSTTPLRSSPEASAARTSAGPRPTRWPCTAR